MSEVTSVRVSLHHNEELQTDLFALSSRITDPVRCPTAYNVSIGVARKGNVIHIDFSLASTSTTSDVSRSVQQAGYRILSAITETKADRPDDVKHIIRAIPQPRKMLAAE